MNPFIAASGVLYLCATAWSLYQGEWRMALVWFAYAVSGFALAGAR